MNPKNEFRGNSYRKLSELNTWTKQRDELPLEPDLPILDSHHHFWNDERRGSYLIPEMLEDIGTGHNIIATVFIETATMYRTEGPIAMRPVGEVEFVNKLANGCTAKSRPGAGIVGNADLTLGDQVRPVLEALIDAGNGRLHGIRYGIAWDSARVGQYELKHRAPPHLALDPTFRQGFAHLRPLGLSFDASLLYTQLPELMDLVRCFPDTSVVLNHCGGVVGMPPHDNREAVFSIWRAHMRELAQFPRVSVKLGGLGMPRSGWTFHLREVPPSSEELMPAWRPYIETCIELFGPERCMMESNFPQDKQTCGYGILWNAMKRITKGYSVGEKAALYHLTAASVYSLKLLSSK